MQASSRATKVRVNGVELAYTDLGTGVPVVLIHGYPLNRAIWDAQVEVLAKRRRVIASDLRGHGSSEAPTGVYSMDLLADDVAKLLDQLKIDRAVVVGFSMGGYVAFAFYRKYANRVRGLVLADTRPQPDSPEEAATGEANQPDHGEHPGQRLCRRP